MKKRYKAKKIVTKDIYTMLRIVGLVIAVLINYLQAQDPDCDHFKYVEPNTSYYVYSPNYPFRYTAGIQCRWIVMCPPGYICDLRCKHVSIPRSPSCEQDRLLISKTGDPQLESAEVHCGRRPIHAVSIDRKISIGLISSSSSRGGRFLCRITTQTKPCFCGIRNMKRIVGGNETKTHEFPMMAGLVFDGEDSVVCGGVVIDKRYVLTAAHCVVTTPIEQVVLGLHDQSILESNSSSTSIQRIGITSSIVHPLYNESTFDYDIAILKLDEDIIYNDFVSPVCLPFKFVNNDFAGDNVTVIGWGTIFVGGPTSDVLQGVTLDVISEGKCRSTRPSVTPRQLCTFTPMRDSCQYDSGGPLLYTDPETKLLFNVGIVSYGTSCASAAPSVNTRVTAFLDWILINAPVHYCRK